MVNGISYNRFNLKNGWPIWLLVGVVVVIIFFIMNARENSQQEEAVKLKDIADQNDASDVEEAQEDRAASPQDAQPAKEHPRDDQKEMASIPQTTKNFPPPLKTSQKSPAVQPAHGISSDELSQSKKPFTIQVASFRDQSKAQKALDDLRKSGYDGFMAMKDLKEKGTWYRVCVGTFDTKDQADQILSKLKKDHKDSFIIVK